MPGPDAPPEEDSGLNGLARFNTPLEDLERLRQELIDSLAREAVVDPSAIDTVGGRIQHVSAAIGVLQQMADKTRELAKKSRRRKWTIGLIAAILLATWNLLLIRRSSAVVSIETNSSDFNFELSKDTALFDGIKGIRSVEIVGVRRLMQDGKEFAATSDVYGLTLRIEDRSAQKRRVKLNRGTGVAGSRDHIGFNSLVLPGNALVHLSENGVPHEVSVRLDKTPVAFKISVSGETSIMVTGLAPRRETFSGPVQVEGTPTDDKVVMTLGFEGTEAVFATPIAAHAVGWNREAQEYSEHPKPTTEETSISSGVLSLKEFKSRTENLRTGESLLIGDAPGYIRRLRVDGSAVYCQYDATVQQLLTREGTIVRNLMPTWLAWLGEQDTLVQFWAAFAYICGLGLAATQWWREPK